MLPEYLNIPLFPLPNVTFFPQTFLPLHVFEPRYRAMLANVLAGDRLLGITLLKDGWQKDYFGNPPICKTFCVGKIIDSELLENGCYNIMVEALYRVRAIGEYPTQPYRTAHVRVLQDPPIDAQRVQISKMMKDLRGLTDHLGRLLPQTRDAIHGAWASHPHPLVIIGHLAAALVVDAYERQSILEQDDPQRRLLLVLIQMRNLVQQLTGRVREEVIEEE